MDSRTKRRETVSLRVGSDANSYGSIRQAPCPSNFRSPPPYSTTPSYFGGSHTAHRAQPDPSPSNKTITTKRRVAIIAVFLLVGQFAAFVYFSDLPTKIGRWNEEMARMRVREGAMRDEARHLEKERTALENESDHLEKERLGLERERKAYEAAIHHSELERSRLEKQKQLLEDEQKSMEREKQALRRERDKWEKAREDRVPQGAFWEVVQPAPDCLSYGKRNYLGTLRNIPRGWDDLDACMNMPVEIKGVSVRRPDRCLRIGGSLHGIWAVDWDQPDCKPWHQDFYNKVRRLIHHTFTLTNLDYLKGCTNPGSGIRRIEAWVVGINEKGGQDWRLLCESTPMTWNHITYNTPTHCDARVSTIS